MSRARQALRWILRGLAALVVVVLIAAAGGTLWLRSRLNGSLPEMQGEVVLAGLSAPVRIEFDALGIPTITAASRLDAARATGYLHAQNRFFQMDLQRRQAAGELSELIGPATLSRDREARLHRFRAGARRDVEEASGAERSLIEAYTAGVNAGLQALASPPFEYLLLQTQPRAWAPEDCVLANLSMFMVLHGGSMERESALGLMHDLLPGPLFEYLSPPGSPWDAPIAGAALPQPPLPGPDVFDLRRNLVASALSDARARTGEEPDEEIPGSNNWAVAGKLTATGAAIVANDMHLPIAVPNTWYRVSIICPGAGGTNRITGVTLPGTPITVVGSNGKIAWGFTNTEGDWMDLVELELAPGDPESYLTPQGPQRLEHHDEVIQVKGAAAEHLDVVETIWGPVVDTDHNGRKRALRWTAHDTEATNIGLLAMETAATLEEAQRAGNLSGIPPQNLMVATADGRIGWSIAGRIPRRVGFDGRLPGSWADGSRRWDGYLPPEEYPRVNDPPSGRLWTANARVVDGAMLQVLGDGGYDFGARAGQIRDDLMALTRTSEREMLSIQLDDRALYMKRWRDLLLAALTPEAVAGHPLRAELRGFLESWGDRAAIDSVGYRMARVSAINIERLIYEPLTAACKRADEHYQYSQSSQYHGVAMALLDQRPPHLLDPQYASWDALILAGVDAGLDFVMADKRPLAVHTWGDRNTTRVQHPISLGVPMLSRWLDMPARQLPGDAWMPRVQGIAFGASERFAVSPGHEQDGYFHMPCGQSGHPLSPHYGDGHDAWAEGRMTSFLPGPAASTLTLVPRS